jgi:uncharacterized protein YfiM (DUF2279 family)
MNDRAALADRTSRLCLQIAFWIPLTICTWLALTPSPPDAVFRVSDVVLHGAAFAYLTFALGLAWPAAGLWAMAGAMFGYGALIEAVQSFEPARSAEVKDLLVDVAGIVTGLLLWNVFGDWSRRTLRRLVAATLTS